MTQLFSMGLLRELGASGALLALLLCGHVLGDFVFQTAAMVSGKRRFGGLVAHGVVVSAVQYLVAAPFWTPAGAAIAFGLGSSHLIIDGLKLVRPKATVQHFVLDQVLHLMLVVAAWRLWLSSMGVANLDARVSAGTVPWLTAGSVLVAGYSFTWVRGAALVEAVLGSLGMAERGETLLGSGRVIGILERLIVLTLVLVGEWGAIGLTLAAKSLARFKDLDHRPASEYYLIGTLTSVLVAVLCGLGIRVLL